MSRIPSNIKVRPLNLAPLLDTAKKGVQDLHPDSKVVKVTTHYGFGIVETPAGVIILDRDGVGCTEPITDDNKAGIPFYGEYAGATEGQTEIDVLPQVQYNANAEQLKELATDPEEALEDFIKKFGTRNEGNYEIWRTFFAPR